MLRWSGMARNTYIRITWLLVVAAMYGGKGDRLPAKVLIAAYEAAPSLHSHIMESLAARLSSRYDVYFLMSDDYALQHEELKSPSTVHFLDFEMSPSMDQSEAVNTINDNPLDLIRKIRMATERNARARFSQQKLLQRIKSANVDLIIYNSMDYGMPAFCHHFNISCIQLISSGIGGVHNPLSLELMNEVPYCLTGYTELDSLWKSLVNTMNYMMDHYMRIHYFYPTMRDIAVESGFVGSNESQTYWQLAANTPKATLMHTNGAVDCLIPLPETYVRIGGALLSNHTLNSNYQHLMDQSANGVVVVAFGRGSYQLSGTRIQHMLKAFSSLPYRFIWSLNSNMTAYGKISPNIQIAKSIPQNGLLAHPNCKLFITHAGLGSTIEAIYHAVPIVAVPFGADQRTNAARLSKYLKMGVSLKANSLTQDQMAHSIEHVISNVQFTENSKLASAKFQQCGKNPANKQLMEVIEDAINSPDQYPRDRTRHWIHIVRRDIIIVLFMLSLVLLSLFAVCIILLVRYVKKRTFEYAKKVK